MLCPSVHAAFKTQTGILQFTQLKINKISSYIHVKQRSVSTHPCHNFNCSLAKLSLGLVKLSLKLGLGWVITSHKNVVITYKCHNLSWSLLVKGPLVNYSRSARWIPRSCLWGEVVLCLPQEGISTACGALVSKMQGHLCGPSKQFIKLSR